MLWRNEMATEPLHSYYSQLNCPFKSEHFGSNTMGEKIPCPVNRGQRNFLGTIGAQGGCSSLFTICVCWLGGGGGAQGRGRSGPTCKCPLWPSLLLAHLEVLPCSEHDRWTWGHGLKNRMVLKAVLLGKQSTISNDQIRDLLPLHPSPLS